ncbi:Transmembrane protein 14C [Coemansia sp. RSA 487]|nr:Transmembrane protein 14C [Coemansia sp. RSA 487]
MIQKRTGIIYLDELKSQASMIAGIALKRQVSNDLVHKVAKAIDTALSNSKGPVSVEINNQINVISSHNSTEAFDLLSSAKEHNDCDMTFLSVSVAEEIGYSGYVDWIFSCSQLIVVANRYNLLQSLVLTKPILSALQLHPKVTILLDEIESNKETISAYTALLQEALPMLGARNELTNKVRISVVPAASIIPELSTEDKQDVAWTERMIQRANSQEMLEGALSAVVSCIESGGGSVSTTSSCEFPPTYQTCNIEYTTQGTQDKHHLATESTTILDSLQTASDMGSETIALSKLSSRIQSEFVNGSDLDAVDTSVGAIKKRVQRWFTSGSIWKAMFMKVEEVSDTLVEDAILDCSFEEADLAMVHASGRLNESIRNAVNELAEALDRFYYVTLSEKEASVSVDPSALSSAKGALCALALRREPVRHFLLARHVWDTRKELVESDTLTEIPAYIRTSLTGFWAINAGSILAGIGSWAYLDSPLIYAFSGSAALAAVSFVWLGYRWRQLSLQLYRQLDYQGIALTRKVIDAHRLELRSKLDQPVHECIGSTSGLQQLIARYSRTTSIGGTNGALNMAFDTLGVFFAAFVALGGAIGYFKSSSVASLVSGLVFGALISLSAQLAVGNSKGYNLAPAIVCFILFVVMGSRFMNSKKFMPAGMVAATSLLMMLRYALRLF